MESRFRLDDLYKMTVHIYGEQNARRSTSETFAHFVEVCGLLSAHARNKKRETGTFVDALCKALGWYFPLMAKCRVASIEELIYRKFPYTCPYCRQLPHTDLKCKTVKGTTDTVNHDALRKSYRDNTRMRPRGINEWQAMFGQIYPRDVDTSTRSVVGLFEELGELAEAVRVFERYPKYLAGEAADVFSYLMGFANEFDTKSQMEGSPALDLEAEYIRRFPGLCIQCGSAICVCPFVPAATVGRMAKELDLHDGEDLFVHSFEQFREQSVQISSHVLRAVGEYKGIAAKFPLDRGEANRALVMLCLQTAEQIGDAQISMSLRSAALVASEAATYAGSPTHSDSVGAVVKLLNKTLENKQDAGGTFTATIGQLVLNMASQTGSNISGPIQSENVRMNTSIEGASDDWHFLLLEQLTSLRNEMSQAPWSPQRQTALVALQEAETAAKSGDESGLKRALKVAGQFTLDIATKMGSDVAAKLIAQSMGLPS